MSCHECKVYQGLVRRLSESDLGPAERDQILRRLLQINQALLQTSPALPTRPGPMAPHNYQWSRTYQNLNGEISDIVQGTHTVDPSGPLRERLQDIIALSAGLDQGFWEKLNL